VTVLGIDTSGILGGVALAEGPQLLGEVRCDARAAASERILAQIDRLLADLGAPPSAIERIGVAIGPGSFTGLRVGLATAKGLALALSVPVVAVSSLRARSFALGLEGRAVLVVTAHRQGSVFCAAGFWTRAGFREIMAEDSRTLAASPQWVAAALGAARAASAGPMVVTGDAATILVAELGEPGGRWQDEGGLLCVPGMPGALPGAVALLTSSASAGEVVAGSELDALVPRYLRGSDARLPRPSQAPRPDCPQSGEHPSQGPRLDCPPSGERP